ncbi:unnamed protein product [Caretta caretta]
MGTRHTSKGLHTKQEQEKERRKSKTLERRVSPPPYVHTCLTQHRKPQKCKGFEKVMTMEMKQWFKPIGMINMSYLSNGASDR